MQTDKITAAIEALRAERDYLGARLATVGDAIEAMERLFDAAEPAKVARTVTVRAKIARETKPATPVTRPVATTTTTVPPPIARPDSRPAGRAIGEPEKPRGKSVSNGLGALVLDVLEKSDAPVNAGMVAKALGSDLGRVAKSLCYLAEQGRIRRAGPGVYAAIRANGAPKPTASKAPTHRPSVDLFDGVPQ